MPVGIARYVRGRELGRGGMGRVLEALDQQFNRSVAIKQIIVNQPAPSVVRRFANEAIVTGHLEHPGNPAGLRARRRAGSAGRIYAMRRVPGRSLSRLLAEATTREQRLAFLPIVVRVAQTVGFAHASGVIHRDLKPDNILVGDLGETYVLDWGLARVRGAPTEEARALPSEGGDGLRRGGRHAGVHGPRAGRRRGRADRRAHRRVRARCAAPPRAVGRATVPRRDRRGADRGRARGRAARGSTAASCRASWSRSARARRRASRRRATATRTRSRTHSRRSRRARCSARPSPVNRVVNFTMAGTIALAVFGVVLTFLQLAVARRGRVAGVGVRRPRRVRLRHLDRRLRDPRPPSPRRARHRLRARHVLHRRAGDGHDGQPADVAARRRLAVAGPVRPQPRHTASSSRSPGSQSAPCSARCRSRCGRSRGGAPRCERRGGGAENREWEPGTGKENGRRAGRRSADRARWQLRAAARRRSGAGTDGSGAGADGGGGGAGRARSSAWSWASLRRAASRSCSASWRPAIAASRSFSAAASALRAASRSVIAAVVARSCAASRACSAAVSAARAVSRSCSAAASRARPRRAPAPPPTAPRARRRGRRSPDRASCSASSFAFIASSERRTASSAVPFASRRGLDGRALHRLGGAPLPVRDRAQLHRRSCPRAAPARRAASRPRPRGSPRRPRAPSRSRRPAPRMRRPAARPRPARAATAGPRPARRRSPTRRRQRGQRRRLVPPRPAREPAGQRVAVREHQVARQVLLERAHQLVGGEPRRRVARHRARDDPRQLGIARHRGRRRVPADEPVEERVELRACVAGRVDGLPHERGPARDDLVERDAEAVDVEARVGLAALALLERQVRRRAGADRHHAAGRDRRARRERGLAPARRVEIARDAPVDQRRLAALAEQDVVRRAVAVHDAPLVRVRERLGDRRRGSTAARAARGCAACRRRLLLGELVEPVAQRHAVDPLEHAERPADASPCPARRS